MREDLLKKVEDKYGQAFANSLKFTMNAEGMFSNHPDDKGGMTIQGIARTYNSKWEGWKIVDKYLEQFPECVAPFRKNPVSLDRLNKALAADDELNMLEYGFYFDNYFIKSGAYDVSKVCEKAGIIIFDISVLQGVKRASKTVQRLLNRYYGCSLEVDGILGSKTFEAFKQACEKEGQEVLINHLLLEFTDNLNEASKLDNNIKFLAGWMNRVLNLRNYLRLLK